MYVHPAVSSGPSRSQMTFTDERLQPGGPADPSLTTGATARQDLGITILMVCRTWLWYAEERGIWERGCRGLAAATDPRGAGHGGRGMLRRPGFHAPSVDEVAERAGYTKGAVYQLRLQGGSVLRCLPAAVEQVLTEVVPGLREAGPERALDSSATVTIQRRDSDRWMAGGLLRVLGARAAPYRATGPLRGDPCHHPRAADGRGAAARRRPPARLPSDDGHSVRPGLERDGGRDGPSRLPRRSRAVDVVLARRMGGCCWTRPLARPDSPPAATEPSRTGRDPMNSTQFDITGGAWPSGPSHAAGADADPPGAAAPCPGRAEHQQRRLETVVHHARRLLRR